MNRNKPIYLVVGICGLILMLSVLSSCKQHSADPYPIDRVKNSKNAMVVSAHPLASAIGSEIMRSGGNAVDAAVATQFALAVVYPRAGNIGGGGFMIIRLPEGDSFALDYRETSPNQSARSMYLNAQNEVIDSMSLYGHMAVGVPGTVAGLIEAWNRFGNIRSLSALIEPAIKIAENGYRINADEAERLMKYRADLIKYNDFPIPFTKDSKWETGDLIIQSDLAQTLRIIKELGHEGFYEGGIAEKIDSQMRVYGGIITKNDLKNYRAIWRDPIEVNYKNYTMISMPPPSSGGIALGQLLTIAASYELKEMGFHSKESIHLLAEAERRIYADRAKHLGDNDFYPVPVDQLLDSAYLVQKMDDFNEDKASQSINIAAGNFGGIEESLETTHTSIVDADGMSVSVTTTLNSNYGSKVMVDGCGFFLNNEMDDFSIKPGVANQFGLVGGNANAIEAGKRMLSSMTPAIIEKEGNLFMVLGSPGGSQIITSVLQVFLNVAEFDMSVAEAVRAPRFHHQWLPDRLTMEEKDFDPEIIRKLKEIGHTIHNQDRIGLVKAIRVLDDGTMEGSGDPRSYDDVEGY